MSSLFVGPEDPGANKNCPGPCPHGAYILVIS